MESIKEKDLEFVDVSITNEDMTNVAYQFVCIDCGKTVNMSKEEKEWYEERQWVMPKRCEECRYRNRKKREKMLRAKNKRKNAKNDYYVLTVKIDKNVVDERGYSEIIEKVGDLLDTELSAAVVEGVNEKGVVA